MISVETLQEPEIPLLEPLVDEFVQSHHALAFRTDYWSPLCAWLAQLLDDPESTAFVARDPEGVVGVGTGVVRDNGPLLTPERIGFVGFLTVAKRCRRQGIASVIWEELRSWFATRGITEAQLYTELGNPASEGFWEAKGFEAILQTRRCLIG
ncbi:GNAT family N-acetyltransferase [Candidatus Latescibacterota bacterium]